MQDLSTFSLPLMEASLWRGALLWAIALYIPLSGALARFESSDEEDQPTQNWRQIILIIGSLLLSLTVGLVTQLAASWVNSPTVRDNSRLLMIRMICRQFCVG